ncbi:hypothetical protein ZHAS_00022043 [Anopheles sinensis]|uniref:Uncharacterized protein n=1 Tax=Anopheles sinensis TaxID=74873 RepID=A0A084WUB1_ANOSI|nr:hypothetical protein ZHAS_00022043 [Anopheles sinensis]
MRYHTNSSYCITVSTDTSDSITVPFRIQPLAFINDRRKDAIIKPFVAKRCPIAWDNPGQDGTAR